MSQQNEEWQKSPTTSERGEDSEEQESKADPPTTHETLLAEEVVTVLLLCFVMLSISALLAVMYYLESQKVEEKKKAMQMIRNFMVSQNQSFEQLNDSAILNEVEKLVDEVNKIDAKIIEVQISIDAFIERVSTGWKQHGGHLYYLSPTQMMFPFAQAACEIRESTLTPITTASEETFVESMSKASKKSVWIGLLKSGKSWKWIDGKTPFRTSFWAPGQPKKNGFFSKDCVEIPVNCATPGSCWNNVFCFERKAAVCRVSPDERWMS